MFQSIYLVRGANGEYVSAGIELKTTYIETREERLHLIAKSDTITERRVLDRWEVLTYWESLDEAVSEVVKYLHSIRFKEKDQRLVNGLIIHRFFELVPETCQLIGLYDEKDFSPAEIYDFLTRFPEMFRMLPPAE